MDVPELQLLLELPEIGIFVPPALVIQFIAVSSDKL